MSTRKKKADPAATGPKSKRLELEAPSDKSRDALLAEVAFVPEMTAATLVTDFSKGILGELSLTDTVAVLKEKVGGVQRGSMKEAEAILASQAFALNTIFTELARRSALNMGQYLDASERYMRMALKAQGQCRATLETLAAIKNPPVVIAKQANVTTGPQQINNGITAPHARENVIVQDELSGGARHELPEDTGTTCGAGGAHPPMEAVGALDRAANR